jgi:hypothetical protein
MGDGDDELLPPPQEHRKSSSAKTPVAHIHPKLEWGPTSSPELRAVVVILTGKFEADVPLTFSLAGTVQVVPVGAPVQLSMAVPLIPCPPMVSV